MNEELTLAFVMFVLQFYPNYAWYFFKSNDYLNTAMCEALTNDLIFQKKHEFGLEEGRAKVSFTKTTDIIQMLYPGVKGLFYKLPVLPTRETWYTFDEIIETEIGQYEKVLSISKNNIR